MMMKMNMDMNLNTTSTMMQKDTMHMDMDSMQTNNAYSSSSSTFCQDTMMSMNMYMNGFEFSLIDSQSKPCLNFFFSNCTLNTRNKFILAMICAICLGMSIDGLAKVKRNYLSSLEEVRHHDNAKQQKQDDVQQQQNSKQPYHSIQIKITLTLFQGIQAFLGYLLMFNPMTYSIELLFSVLFELGLGYFLFGSHEFLLNVSSEEGGNHNSGNGGGGGLCHDFDDDNFEEIHHRLQLQRKNKILSTQTSEMTHVETDEEASETTTSYSTKNNHASDVSSSSLESKKLYYDDGCSTSNQKHWNGSL